MSLLLIAGLPAIPLLAGIPLVFIPWIVKYGAECSTLRHMPEIDADKLRKCRTKRMFFIILTAVTALAEAVIFVKLMSEVVYL